jgi:hypothetical protein
MLMNNNLKEISNFVKKNNSISDFNLVHNFLFNLNFTKLNFKNNQSKQVGGTSIITKEEALSLLNQGILSQEDISNLINQGILTQDDILMNQSGLLPVNPVGQIMDQPVGPIIDQPTEQIIDQPIEQIIVQPIEQPNIVPIISSNEISNPFSSNEQKIQMVQDMHLEKPEFTSDKINTYTIKEGTILYHSTTNKKGFNTNYIEFGNDKIINFFTPNFRLASDKIEGCSIDKQNGYIHVFRVKQDIPNIYIKLPYDIADDIDSGSLANQFCSQNQKYSGIGFFYPKNNIEMFSNNLLNPNVYNNSYQQTQSFSDLDYYSEFGLCNPRPYLEYLYSQKCQSLRKLSDPYRFNN